MCGMILSSLFVCRGLTCLCLHQHLTVPMTVTVISPVVWEKEGSPFTFFFFKSVFPYGLKNHGDFDGDYIKSINQFVEN